MRHGARRSLALGLALIMSFGIAGCGGAQKAAPPITSNATRTATDVPGATTAITAANTHEANTAVPTGTVADPASPQPARTQAGNLAVLGAGHVLFQVQCASCHALVAAGISSPPGATGSALDHVGAHHDRAWLETELTAPCRNARSSAAQRRCVSMPSYVGLTQQQRDQIVAYLLAQR